MTAPTAPEPQAPSPFLELDHPRVRSRAEPRASIALAGAGCVLAVVGAMVLAADQGAGDGGEFSRWPGLVTSVLVMVVGFGLLELVARGPLATAGTVAAALGVPAALVFLTLQPDEIPPYSTNVILLGSTGAWLAAYVLGPGRGRPLFLAAGAIGVWASLLQLSEKVFDAPFAAAQSFSASFDSTVTTFDPITGEPLTSSGTGGFDTAPAIHTPDWTTVGLISLALGIAFLAACVWLDRTGRRGAATPLLAAAIPALVVGALTLADDLEAAGTGLLLGAVGAGLIYTGSSALRRGTTWIGAAVATVGLAVILSDATDDATIGGTLFLLGGAALVLVAVLLARAVQEPDEMLVVPPRWVARATSPAPRKVVAAEGDEPPEDPVDPPDHDWAPPPPV